MLTICRQSTVSINKSLILKDYKIIPNRRSISATQVKSKVEYNLFNSTQQIDSVFDKEIHQMLDK